MELWQLHCARAALAGLSSPQGGACFPHSRAREPLHSAKLSIVHFGVQSVPPLCEGGGALRVWGAQTNQLVPPSTVLIRI